MFFSLIITFLLVGCQQKVLLCFEINSLDFNVFYRIKDLNRAIIVYYPIATNDKIKKIEIEDYSAVFDIHEQNNGDLGGVTIKPLSQDKLNQKIKNGFISFFKCQVLLKEDVLRKYNSISLWQTKLKVFGANDCKRVVFAENYLTIEISSDDEYYPDLQVELNNLKDKYRKPIKVNCIK